MKLIEFYRDIYRPLRLIGGSQRTDVLYRYSIELFSSFLGRPAELTDLNDLTVGRHLQALIDEGRKRPGINKERAQLLALWRLAARKHLVSEFPEIKKIPEPETDARAWTMEELQRLYAACAEYSGETYFGIPANKWWLALVSVCYTTGERKTAVLKSEWTHLSGNRLLFPAENRKGSKKNHIATLTPFCMNRLAQIRSNHRLIFPWPKSPNYEYHIYNKILESAGLPKDSKSKFHRLRKSHATHLKAAGGDPTQSLGHSSAATTNRYIDLRMIPDKNADLLPEPVSDEMLQAWSESGESASTIPMQCPKIPVQTPDPSQGWSESHWIQASH